jgi:hypothetical protein
MKNLKEAIAKRRQVALYANMEHEYVCLNEVRFVDYDEHFAPLLSGQTREITLDGYVRVSKPVEVDFSAIGNDEIVAKAVESLTETERKIQVETEQKLAKIREQKKQLLALTYQPEAAS